ncbi:putative leucine-rich repeat domain superfamily [Helianthus anomalus]
MKTLDIVAYNNPFANAFKLIVGCPILESLSLEVTKCNSEEDLIFNIPTLKRLKLSLSFINPASVINKVVLNVPNLEYLFVDGVSSSSFVMEDVSSLVNLPCLKTLDIVAYTNPFVNAFKLINDCPVLESLSLEITMCKYKKDFMFIIPTLKRLKLSFIKHASVLNKIVLNVPNFEYLFVHGVLSSSFVMEDVSSLVEASISCTQMRNHHLWFELLKGINGVQSLSAKNVISNIDFKIPLSSPLLVFPNMKHLELKDVCQYGQISHFLERCPGLKHLRIDM